MDLPALQDFVTSNKILIIWKHFSQRLSCSDIPNVDVFHYVKNEIQENSTFISISSDLLRDILK